MVGDLLLRQRQAVTGSGAVDAERDQAVAQLKEESGETFLAIGAPETDIPVVEVPLVLRELPGEKHRDAELSGGQLARFLVMDPPRRGRGQRLDRIGLLRHEDRLDAADLAWEEQHNDLPAAVGEGPASR